MRIHHRATGGSAETGGSGSVEDRSGCAVTELRVDRAMVAEAQNLRRRAVSLRLRADTMQGPLCLSYRRRASELMLEAWLLEIRSGLPFIEIPSAA